MNLNIRPNNTHINLVPRVSLWGGLGGKNGRSSSQAKNRQSYKDTRYTELLSGSADHRSSIGALIRNEVYTTAQVKRRWAFHKEQASRYRVDTLPRILWAKFTDVVVNRAGEVAAVNFPFYVRVYIFDDPEQTPLAESCDRLVMNPSGLAYNKAGKLFVSDKGGQGPIRLRTLNHLLENLCPRQYA